MLSGSIDNGRVFHLCDSINNFHSLFSFLLFVFFLFFSMAIFVNRRTDAGIILHKASFARCRYTDIERNKFKLKTDVAISV